MTGDRRLNPSVNSDHRRAVRCLMAAREFWGTGRDEAGQRAYETALSLYLRAGLDPQWVSDGGLSTSYSEPDQTDIPAVTVSATDEVSGDKFVILMPNYRVTDGDREFIATRPEDLVEVER